MISNYKSIIFLTLLFVVCIMVGCEEEVSAPPLARIEHLEGTWLVARESYGVSNPSNPEAKFHSLIIRLKRCEGADCYWRTGGTYQDFTYDYRIEVGLAKEDSPEPFLNNQLENNPEFAFVNYWNVFGSSQLFHSDGSSEPDTLSILKISQDSLLFSWDNLGLYKITEQRFKRVQLPELD